MNHHVNSNESQLAYTSSNKAIPLILINENDNHEMQVSEIAIKLLSRRTSNKVAVVSIFGECNTGKSFLLNQLLKVPNAFEVNRPKKTALSRLI